MKSTAAFGVGSGSDIHLRLICCDSATVHQQCYIAMIAETNG